MEKLDVVGELNTLDKLDPLEKLLSKRGELARDWEDFLLKYIHLTNEDRFDEKNNSMGYVNLGTSVNNLCNDIIYPKLTSNDVWSCDTSLLQYCEFHGIIRLREVFAKLITEFFEVHEPVSADDILCFTGVTSCIDVLVHCLADPGEVFLIPTPMYGRIFTNIKQRALVDAWPIPIIAEDNTEDFPVLTIEKVISAYENAVAKKSVVRGIFLISPSNPLGDVYSPKLLMDILMFCKEKSLHLIIDEVYALSIFSKSEKFHSVLKFSHLPDPNRVHVLYGLSKDFGIAGLRIGLIHTKCKPLKKSLIQLSFFQNIPFPVMEIVARYLENIDWCRNYINTNQQRMAEKFEFCVNFLRQLGLKVRDSHAGFFLWVDLRHLCGSSFDEEMNFFNYLIEKAHLYIGPGKKFFCAQPGWFRIVFTGNPDHLKEGLNRFERALKAYK